MPDLYVCGFTRVAYVLKHAEIRVQGYTEVFNISLKKNSFFIISKINITFNSNSALKITDARRLSQKLDCLVFFVLFCWRHVDQMLDKLSKTITKNAQL